ncbi:MAG: terminase [Hyphomicrobiales bacterium]|nr:MAG: terminase [Hyphomicrobiales bacterium]
MSLADDLLSRFGAQPKQKKQQIMRTLDRMLKDQIWIPNEGPQTEAYFSRADLLLYGGQAGGGKTDLIVGLALNAHKRVGIFRQQVGELKGLIDRMDQVLLQAGRKPVSRSANQWTGADGAKIEFGHLEKSGAHKSWQGRDHDLKCFDEASQIAPHKILYVMSWLRSAIPGQHCRTVLASNPPMGGEGDYLLEWFGPWVDPMHRLYGTVKPGELLWAVFESEGEDIRTIWCDGPEPQMINGRLRTPRSRSFIPAGLGNNPFLGEDYRAQLDSMPEPLRTALLTGDFLAGRSDHARQVIPADWIVAAQARWLGARHRHGESHWRRRRMLSLGVDVAQGGADSTTLAPLMEGNVFGTITRAKGVDTRDGPAVGGMVVQMMRDSCAVAVDMTGGWGGGARLHLENNHIPVTGMVASQGSNAVTRDSRIGFANRRAEWWWRFREALDPKSGDGVALPPGARLAAELAAPRWKLLGRKILIESKDDIRARLGRSTDEADAVIMAWAARFEADTRALGHGSGPELEAEPYTDPHDYL